MIRSDLDGELKERLCAILLSTGVDPHLSPTLAWFSLERFAPVTYEHYAPEERVLRECESALGTTPRHRRVRGSSDHVGRQPPGS